MTVLKSGDHLLTHNRYRRYRHLLAQLMSPEPSSLLA